MSHSATLDGLEASTLYHYRVKSEDAAGNIAVSDDFTFTTAAPPDTTAPVISDVATSDMTSTGASVAWNTDEASDSQVEYGTSTSYGSSTTINSSMVTSHSTTLDGLEASTLYHYRVKSQDAAGNMVVSDDFTFTTSAPPDTTVPTVVSSNFDFAAMPQNVSIQFSEDVSASLDGSELSLVNLVSGDTIPASDLSFSYGNDNVASWSYVPGILPDGDYRATLTASSVSDAAGNSLAADSTIDFFTLAGDTNRDRMVDFSDMVNLAQHYNTTGTTFDQGDFNMDHVVDFNDLVILAQNYNSGLPPVPVQEAAQAGVVSSVGATADDSSAVATETTKSVFSTTPVKRAHRPMPRHRAWTLA